jgi:hypothetical protein
MSIIFYFINYNWMRNVHICQTLGLEKLGKKTLTSVKEYKKNKEIYWVEFS